MNAQGVTIERRMRRPILSSLHAAFSFGGFAGAGLGAVAAALGVAPLPHLALAAVLFGIPGLLAIRPLLRDDEDADAHAPALRSAPARAARLLGVACFFCLMAEGGVVGLERQARPRRARRAPPRSARSPTRCSASRWASDGWSPTRFGRGGARSGCCGGLGALAAVGFAAGLAIGTVRLGDRRVRRARVLAWRGSCPTLFRAGADQPGVPTGPALAAVSSLGYLGFLAGPPLIGGVAQLTSLRAAVRPAGARRRAGDAARAQRGAARPAPPRPVAVHRSLST